MLTVTAERTGTVDAVRAVGDCGGQIGEHLAGRIHARAAMFFTCEMPARRNDPNLRRVRLSVAGQALSLI